VLAWLAYALYFLRALHQIPGMKVMFFSICLWSNFASFDNVVS